MEVNSNMGEEFIGTQKVFVMKMWVNYYSLKRMKYGTNKEQRILRNKQKISRVDKNSEGV